MSVTTIIYGIIAGFYLPIISVSSVLILISLIHLILLIGIRPSLIELILLGVIPLINLWFYGASLMFGLGGFL